VIEEFVLRRHLGPHDPENRVIDQWSAPGRRRRREISMTPRIIRRHAGT
jgi:hypothetical protein